VNFEPKSFFIAIVDFFSILMPGAMLAYLLRDWAAEHFGIQSDILLNDTESGLVFLFSSYLLGHFIFLISSTLDELIYDRVRGWTHWGQITKRLAQGRPMSPAWQRALATSHWLFGKNADLAVVQAQRVKARVLQRIDAVDSINVYQWSKAKFAIDSPESLSAVQRFEADSKFFRSFFVVLLALTLFYASYPARLNGHAWLAAIVCLVGTLPALWRYIDQRFKGTQQAYFSVITQESMKTGAPAAFLRGDGLTHAGGVVCCRVGAEWKFLLVRASVDRTQLVLPKGHIEPGEDPRVTAVREVMEETGYWARAVRWLEDASLPSEDTVPIVRWYLMEVFEDTGQRREDYREPRWFTLAEAIEGAQFQETKKLLEKAGLSAGDRRNLS
jgi:8-oxo-dGTP pyrophosphatase MutT (NUDIX family)